MKLLIFLFISHCTCIEYEANIDNLARRIQKNPEFEDDCIVHPCSTSDMKCIRNYFATHGHCKPAYGPIPEPLTMDRMALPMSTSNISFTMTDVQVSGLNGEVTSFYINKKTNNLVLAFVAKNLDVSSPTITFIYNRKGKEPIRLTDGFFVTYSAVTFTATIPNINDLQLSKAYVYAYLHDNNPNYGMGPGVAQSHDPVVLKAFNDLLLRLPENAKESLVIQARNFMNVFIQNNICDFGLGISA